MDDRQCDVTGPRPRLLARWMMLGVALLTGWACNNNPNRGAENGADAGVADAMVTEPQQVINRKIDIIFQIDDTDAPEQVNLARNFPTFINVLKNLPGGLPDLHIGVITSDVSAGAFTKAFTNLTGCGVADNANFVSTIRAATDPRCNTATLNAGQHFIISSNGGTQNNFTGDITDVFSCIAQVGTGFCGFEQPLEAVRSAIGDATGDPLLGIPALAIPPTSIGFLRPDAALAVIFINEREECSSIPTSLLFDPNGRPSLGPLTARCFSHADICDGQPVINYVLAGRPAGPFQNCVPDEKSFTTDPTHALIPVQFYIDYFKKLKPNPANVLVAGIIPPASPYALGIVPDGMGGTFVALGTSCQGAAGVFGTPVPRLTKFFSAFPQAVTTSVCDQSYTSALMQIATKIGLLLGP